MNPYTVKIVRWSVVGGLLATVLVLRAFRERESPAMALIRERRARIERDLICQQDVALARTAKDSARAFAGEGPLGRQHTTFSGWPDGQCVMEAGRVRWVKR